ncbi:glycosyltransferase family 87 protein [Flavobacterium cerinum]|uniref:DUF2029 domain-containing protein n=1 Tax=Flavobacterium cerinum TaxID=2502784 RepID=A0ABY5IV30_9FLAO|nr:glycosyltransferase family 87 protein [Flavobacterium cerinum]UUC46645.1 DUF2029 domain-containing protein [Flavobacterium cerinum]
MKQLFKTYYPLFPIIALCGFYVYQATGFVLHDFANYYFGGYFFSEGHFTSDLYFPDIFNREIATLGYTSVFTSFAPNTPFLTLLFYPFHFVNPFTAKLVFNLISCVLFLYSLSRIFRFYTIKPVYLIVLPVLFFIPIKNNLLFGQLYFLLFFLLAEGWLAYERKRFTPMALFWSLAILIKIFPAILILFLLFRKNYKAALLLIGFCFGFTLLSVLTNGIEIWIFFLRDVFPKASNGEIATAFVDNYQSVHMFLKRLFIFDPIENQNPVFDSPLLFKTLLTAFKLSLLFIGYCITKNDQNKLFAFSYWIIAAILVSPYGSTYTFILLLFPFLYLVKQPGSLPAKTMVLLLLFISCNIPISILITKTFPVSYLRMAFVIAFSVWYLSSIRNSIPWKKSIWIPVFSVLIGISGFYLQTKDNSTPILPKDSPILIYDYTVSDDQLRYFFRDENGEHSATIPLPEVKQSEALIQNNQIFYNNKQQTFGSDHKRKAIVLDRQTLLYLSDYDRGIGFYTLRKSTIH